MSFTGSFRVPLGSAVSRLSHTVTKSNAKEIATGAQGLRVPVIRRKSPELQSFNARIGAVSCLGISYLTTNLQKFMLICNRSI